MFDIGAFRVIPSGPGVSLVQILWIDELNAEYERVRTEEFDALGELAGMQDHPGLRLIDCRFEF